MGIANVVNMCAHLQNCSRARLGITSLPNTRYNLYLALALHRAGFLGSIMRAGTSPPPNFPASTTTTVSSSNSSSGNSQAPPMPHWPKSAHEVDLSMLRAMTPSISKNHVQLLHEAPELERGEEPHIGLSPEIARIRRRKRLTRFQKAVITQRERDLQLLKQRQAHNQTLSAADVDKTPDAQLDAEIKAASDSLSQIIDEAETAEELDEAQTAEEGGVTEEPDDPSASSALSKSDAEFLASLQGLPISPAGTLNRAPDDKLSLRTQLIALGLSDDPTSSMVTSANVSSRRLWVALKYWQGEPVLRSMHPYSTPKRAFTLSLAELQRVARGLPVRQCAGLQLGEALFLTTDVGVLESREALDRRRGGGVLCRVS